MLERVDRMTKPPVVGRYYLVPTVRFLGWGITSAWPVMGPRHEDTEHLDYPHIHYHVDARFLSRAQVRAIQARDGWAVAYAVARTPLVNSFGSPPSKRSKLKRLRCRAPSHDYPTEPTQAATKFRNLYDAFKGAQCKSGKAGWICPHRNFALGSIAPIDGIVTCPLHGMLIDAASGVCLGANTRKNRDEVKVQAATPKLGLRGSPNKSTNP